MDKTEHEIRRGERAKQILADDLIKEAREHIEACLWKEFKDTVPENLDTLKFIKGMQYFHAKYFEFFERAVTNGKMANARLEEKKRPLMDRIRAFR